MSADIKAAMEWAKHFQSGEAYPLTNLAAAFIEVEEGLRAEKLAHEKSNRLQIQLQAELEQEQLGRVGASMSMMLEPLAALADASDRYTLSQGCAIPFVHDGDDSMVAEPARYLIPFLRKRSQPYYLTMRDACGARNALRALAPSPAAGGQTESAVTQSGQFATKSDSKESPIGDSALAADPIVAHSKSLYRRLSTQGANVVPPADPTIAECLAAGRGPMLKDGKYSEGGLPNTPQERERFEAYMKGHCWDIGKYDDALHAYDSVLVRMLYGVWRDRGALASATADPALPGLDYAAEKGIWTLKAPSGKCWMADSPLATVGAERRERVPADVALARIREACQPTAEDLADAEALRIEGLELAAGICDAIGVDWRDAGDITKFYATNYLVDAIRAEIAKRTK